MRTAAILALLGMVGGTSGCGALFIPRSEELPSPALRVVRVVDCVTGQPVANADLSVLRIPWSDYDMPPPWATWGTAVSEQNAVYRLTRHVKEQDVHLTKPAMPLGDGRYVVVPADYWRWDQVTFPFGMPVGTVVYHTYQTYVIVSAPNYKTVWVSDFGPRKQGERMTARYEFENEMPPQPGPDVKVIERGVQVALPSRDLPTWGPIRRSGLGSTATPATAGPVPTAATAGVRR